MTRIIVYELELRLPESRILPYELLLKEDPVHPLQTIQVIAIVFVVYQKLVI